MTSRLYILRAAVPQRETVGGAEPSRILMQGLHCLAYPGVWLLLQQQLRQTRGLQEMVVDGRMVWEA